jgi:3'(2'), 5'-bisphosphate nucleotidase
MYSDHDLARRLADDAGECLLAVRRRPDLVDDPAALKAAGDLTSHDLLVSRLAELAPGDAFLSEEGADDRQRLQARRVWIVDPLDGTREFSEVPRTDWAVHVALWADGDLTAGAVAMPAAGLTFATDDPPPRPRTPVDPIRLAVSRTRPPAFVERLAEVLGATLVSMGSAGVKAMSVLRDETDAYVHAGGQFEWDSAAPVAVARAAGLHTSRIDGSSLRYNQPDPTLPDLVVCRPDLAERILAAIATVQSSNPARSTKGSFA